MSPDDYLRHKEQVTADEENLRIARYYRKHLEHRASIDAALLKTISVVKVELQRSHPGYLDMSLNAMDSNLQKLIQTDDSMEVEETDALSSLQAAAAQNKCVENIYPVSPNSAASTKHAASSTTADATVNEFSPLATQEHGSQNLDNATASPYTPMKRKSKKQVGTTPALTKMILSMIYHNKSQDRRRHRSPVVHNPHKSIKTE